MSAEPIPTELSSCSNRQSETRTGLHPMRSPVRDFLTMGWRHRPQLRYYPRALLYLFKLSIWEPFRIAERLVARLRREDRTLPHAPIFILGYYRSGTTHLQETLLQDPRFSYINFYQGFFPTAFTSTERWVKPLFELAVRSVKFKHPSHGTPFTFAMPAEEDVSMVASGFRHASNWGQVYPHAFKEIFEHTTVPGRMSKAAKRAIKDHLNDLYWRVSKANGHRPLVLKSPPQLARVALLREMYPDAKFIFIRRNPFDVFASNKKLWRSFEDLWMRDVSKETVREYILWSHDLCHREYERSKQDIPEGNLCEVSFEEFRATPEATMRRIYDTLSIGGCDEAGPAIEQHLKKTHIPSQPPYSLTEIEQSAVAERLGHWLNHWGYSHQFSSKGARP